MEAFAPLFLSSRPSLCALKTSDGIGPATQEGSCLLQCPEGWEPAAVRRDYLWVGKGEGHFRDHKLWKKGEESVGGFGQAKCCQGYSGPKSHIWGSFVREQLQPVSLWSKWGQVGAAAFSQRQWLSIVPAPAVFAPLLSHSFSLFFCTFKNTYLGR